MAKIATTEISRRTNISASLTTINQNFSVLTESLNNLLSTVNLSDKTISGVSSINVSSSATPVTDVLVRTNGSIAAGGNITSDKQVKSNTAYVEGDVTINSGSLSMNSDSSILAVKGDFIVSGEIVLNDFNVSAPVLAHTQGSFSAQVVKISDFDYQIKSPSTGSAPTVGGLLKLNGRSGVVIDWSQYSSSLVASSLNVVLLDTADISVGQTVRIIAKLGSNYDKTFYIAPNTIAQQGGKQLKGIKITNSYDCIELIFDGSKWIVLSLVGAVLDYSA